MDQTHTTPSEHSSTYALVVDDFPFSQELTKELLQSLNCRVDVAEDGVQALQRYHSNTYDIIFMDVQMPNMTGLEATKQIRQEENNQKHTPIIALTANFQAEEIQDCLDAGMDECVNKPISGDDLKLLLRKHLKARAP